jgi:hypothetical protein
MAKHAVETRLEAAGFALRGARRQFPTSRDCLDLVADLLLDLDHALFLRYTNLRW